MTPSAHTPASTKLLKKILGKAKKWEVSVGGQAALLYCALITPEIATEVMEHCNLRNRKIRQSKVNTWAKRMKEKLWQLRGSIAFTEGGELLDGQHRLLGVVASGEPVPFFIQIFPTRMAKAVNRDLDEGVPRNLADYLHFNGVIEAQRVAPILVKERNDRISGNPLQQAKGEKPDFLALYEDIGEPVFKQLFSITPRGLHLTLGIERSFVEWFAMRIMLVDASQAELFLGLLDDPAQLRASDPAYAMRQVLFDLDRRQVKVFPVQHAHLLAKTWRYFAEGQPVTSHGKIKHRVNEPWPGIFGEEVARAPRKS